MLPTVVQSASRSSASSSSPPRAWQSAGGSRCRRARRDGAECVVRVRLCVEAEELVALERRAVVRLPAARASQIAGWIAQRRSARRDRAEDERRRSPRATNECKASRCCCRRAGSSRSQAPSVARSPSGASWREECVRAAQRKERDARSGGGSARTIMNKWIR